jgi:DNA invertase Pin-like site-specific DNA recombinase
MSEAKYRAAKYIRLSYADAGSKDKGKDESDSVANQRRLLDSYIQGKPDIEAVSEMVDDGYTGILFERPKFKEMMEEIKAGKINCVIVKDLSRFGREYIETGRYLRRILPSYGVRFIAIDDSIDTLKDRGDDLVVSVKTVINDAYCRDISVKTRSALNVKRENGDYVGACPVYGYMKAAANRNLLVIDEYPASVVRDIFRMKTDGMSAAKIAETLNSLGVLSPMAYKRDRGLPHPTGGFADRADAKWSATAVIRILNDETYTGKLIQGRRGKPNYKIKDVIDRPRSEWKSAENAHEAIITKDGFDLVRRIMRLDTRTAPGGSKVYLFSGILICGSCGARMTRKTVPGRGKSYHYYYCPTGKKRGCHGAASLKEEDLASCVLGSVKAHIRGIASVESMLLGNGIEEAGRNLARRIEVQIAENGRQLEKISRFKSSLYENMVGGILTKDDYRALKEKYASDEKALREALSALESERDDALLGKAERLRFTEHFRQFGELAELDRRIVVNLIESIKVNGKNELEFSFLYNDEYKKALALLGKEAA